MLTVYIYTTKVSFPIGVPLDCNGVTCFYYLHVLHADIIKESCGLLLLHTVMIVLVLMDVSSTTSCDFNSVYTPDLETVGLMAVHVYPRYSNHTYSL